ncbi:MAG: hypothetical protein JSW27_19405 [Phycisphaerales bacterium]|nr:MAG: hypothetical protein JSW27_19405 [Phycisphaerales bacterium]
MMYRELYFVVFLVGVLGMAGPAEADLIAHWRLDEGAGMTAYDDTGNGYDGTLNGDPTWVAGVYKGGLDLDGDGDFVDFGDPQDWPSGGAPRSLCGWGLTDSVAGGYRWLAAYGSPGTSQACFIGMNGDRIIGGGYNGDDVDVAGFWEVGEWTHVALTYDGTTARLYGDGVEVGAMGKNWNLVLNRAFIGEQVNSAGEYWDGLVDDVCLFDHTLSPEEILDVMAGLKSELAGDPVPEDEALDVPREVVLSWAPGEFAARHDVYFGTAFDDVNDAGKANPMGVLVSQNQTETTYDPPARLDFDQTYYWRVDEVNAAPDNTVFKGDVWSFTTEPFAYPIQNVVATSNASSEASAGPENTVNGSGLNATGEHSTDSADMWLGMASGADPIYLQYEFDRVYKLHEMLVWNYNVQFELLLGFGLKGVTVEHSENGTDWIVLGDFELAQATARSTYTANTTINFAGVAARYVKLTVNSGFGMMGQFGLSEVRFLYIPVHARQPQPADGAVDVSPLGALAWRAGREAAAHEVYVSGDEAAVTDGSALIETVTANSLSLSPLDLHYDSTYYWKINEVNEAEAVSIWEGLVWSFQTQAYTVVEDFESYDDEENRIYDTWLDGWVNETGSTVGHQVEPFAETSIIHGGAQSMPLFYDNVGVATSEAELMLDTPQDWTGNGIQSLSLYFRGASDNAGGQLYLEINDTRVDYHGAASDISTPLWQAWNVDLSALGANLQNVTRLTIGVEGAGAQGVVYIDDIRLYPQAAEYITPMEPDAANLVGYWALDGNANDSSGNGYDGTEVGGPTYVAGKDGQAVRLDGVDDYIDLGNPADWPSGTAPRTMSAWAMTNSVEAGWRWAVAYGTDAAGQAMFLGMNTADLYGGGYGDDVSLANFWVMGEWHHLGLTYDGTTARLYADGIEVAAAAKTWDLVLNRAHIGQQVNDFFEFWNGSVDEVRLYKEALTAGEMAWLAGRTAPMHRPF